MKALLGKMAVVAPTVVAADQLTKTLVREHLALCTTKGALGCDRWRLAESAELIRVRNAGSAFGFLQDLWIWAPIAAIALILVLLYARSGKASAVIAVAAGLQLGGAVGNLIDRLFLRGATDFIYLGAGPVFNLADVAVLLGTVFATWKLASGLGRNGTATTDDSVRLELIP